MIITEFFRVREDGVNLYRTYSDRGLRIENEQTHEVFDEAVNVDGSTHTYTETDEPIQDEITDSEALNILLGRDMDESS